MGNQGGSSIKTMRLEDQKVEHIPVPAIITIPNIATGLSLWQGGCDSYWHIMIPTQNLKSF